VQKTAFSKKESANLFRNQHFCQKSTMPKTFRSERFWHDIIMILINKYRLNVF